jgi:hypothetical protein
MRFGLFDLDELPSLKEFEALAQAALGDDTGIAPTEPEDSSVAPAASAESGTGTEVTGSVPDDPIEADVAAASGKIHNENAINSESNSPDTDSARAAAASGGKRSSEPGS